MKICQMLVKLGVGKPFSWKEEFETDGFCPAIIISMC